MSELKYTAIFEPSEESGYTVHVPALEGLITEGDSLDDAISMAKDAIRCHIEALIKQGLPVPDENDRPEPRIEKLAVNIIGGFF